MLSKSMLLEVMLNVSFWILKSQNFNYFSTDAEIRIFGLCGLHSTCDTLDSCCILTPLQTNNLALASSLIS